MPIKRLMARGLSGLKPGPARVDYFDDDPAGFGLRVSPDGSRTWFYRFRSPTLRGQDNRGLKRRIKIGTYPALSLADARRRAHGHRHDVESGIDPAEAKQERREAESFGALADAYLERYRKRDGSRKITHDEDRRLIERELRPAWGRRLATEITRRDVKALVGAIAARGAPVGANRTLALISSMFNWAIDEEMVEANPAYRLKRPGQERSRERVLTDEEIRTLWTALDAEPAVYAVFYRLALLTGQRMGGRRAERGELLWATWEEFDEASGWWTIPGARTKNGLMHRVYVGTVTARAQVAALRTYRTTKALTSPYLFVTPRSPHLPVTRAKHVIGRIRRTTGLTFRPHDLRRTVATRLTASGIARSTVKKLLNHTEDDVTAVYDRYSYDAEVRVALERWERLLLGILAEQAAPKVVAIR